MIYVVLKFLIVFFVTRRNKITVGFYETHDHFPRWTDITPQSREFPFEKVDDFECIPTGIHYHLVFQFVDFLPEDTQDKDVIVDYHIQQGKGKVIDSLFPEPFIVHPDAFLYHVKEVAFFFLKRNQQIILHYKAEVVHRYLVGPLMEFHHLYGDKKTVIEFFHLRSRIGGHHIREYVGRNLQVGYQLVHQFFVVHSVDIQPSKCFGIFILQQFSYGPDGRFIHVFEVYVEKRQLHIIGTVLSAEF